MGFNLQFLNFSSIVYEINVADLESGMGKNPDPGSGIRDGKNPDAG